MAAVLGVVVLVPVYMEGGEELDGLDATTVSNLKNEAKALWAPLVMGYVFTYGSQFADFGRSTTTIG